MPQKQLQGAIVSAGIGNETRGLARELGEPLPAGLDDEGRRCDDLGRGVLDGG